MLDVTFYHNPDCGTSRNALDLLQHIGIEPSVIEYLKTPPTKDRLRELVALMGLPVRDVIRERGTPFKALGLDRPSLSDEDLLDAMVANPILINRPIVVTPTRVRLCRPSETVLDLMPASAVPKVDLTKDDGTPFLVDGVFPADNDLEAHVAAAGLPTDDLRDPGRTFYRYGLFGGTTVGFGGLEPYGTDVLLRSLCVMPSFHRRGVGRNMALLLMSRAFDLGARQAYALPSTPESSAFFQSLGFAPIPRPAAPPAILATRQASGLCPASTPLLTRRIAL